MLLTKVKKKGNKVGKLHFKSDIKTIALKNDAYSIQKNGTVRIQKIKKPLFVRGLKQIPEGAELADAKLLKKPSGYYIKITTYSTPKLEIKNERKSDVGLDFGIKHNVTTSDGEKFSWSIEETERLKRLQRRIAKAKKGSNNRRKLCLLLEKEYEKINNRKNDAANKFCHYLFDTYRMIYVQDDNLAKWMKKENNRHSGLSHSLLGRIKRKLFESKKQVIIVERFAPSTKQCYKCGFINNVKRSDVLFECEGCGHTEDRDIKAAKTIMMFGKISSLDAIPTDHRAMFAETGTSTSDASHQKHISVVEARRLEQSS